MTEGFIRALAGDRFEVESAGTEATRVHPLAVRAMDEVGVNLQDHSSSVPISSRSGSAVKRYRRKHVWMKNPVEATTA